MICGIEVASSICSILNFKWLILGILVYLLFVIWFFRGISYHCVMACMSCYDYSIKNFIIALFFPVYLIVLLVGAILELIGIKKEIDFEDFKKKKEKEYKKLVLTKKGVKKI